MRREELDSLMTLVEDRLTNKETTLEWQDIVDTKNLDVHRDVLRKAMQPKEFGAYAVYKMLTQNPIGDNEILARIRQEKEELLLVKQEARDWTREKRKHMRELHRIEQLKRSFEEAYEKSEKPALPDYERITFNGNKKGVLSISDAHIGMEIDNPWRKYNLSIATSNFNNLADDVINYCLMMGVSELHVLLLGDLISGSIHATSRLAEEMDVLDQAINVSELISSFLYKLSSKGLAVKLVSVAGNHDRVNKKFKEHIEAESFLKIINWHIKKEIASGRLDIEFLDNEYSVAMGNFTINGLECFAVHGDKDSPKAAINNMMKATHKVPDIVFMGHFHSRQEITDSDLKIYVNGSMVGCDEYAKDKRYFSKPTQSLLVFDDNNRINIEIAIRD